MNFHFVLVQFDVVHAFISPIKTGPQKNSPLAPLDLFINKHNELMWKSSIKSEYYLIELSIDHGNTWTVINRTLKSPYYINSNEFQMNHSQ